MSMINERLAELLSEYADLFAMNGGDGIRVRSYKTAAEAIRGFSVPLSELADVREVPGVGEAIAKKSARPAERRTWLAAVVTDVGGGSVKVRTLDGRTGALAGEDVAWARAGKGIGSGDLIWVDPAQGDGFRLKQIPIVNGALVAPR